MSAEWKILRKRKLWRSYSRVAGEKVKMNDKTVFLHCWREKLKHYQISDGRFVWQEHPTIAAVLSQAQLTSSIQVICHLNDNTPRHSPVPSAFPVLKAVFFGHGSLFSAELVDICAVGLGQGSLNISFFTDKTLQDLCVFLLPVHQPRTQPGFLSIPYFPHLSYVLLVSAALSHSVMARGQNKLVAS